jgi:hypothetical protein
LWLAPSNVGEAWEEFRSGGDLHHVLQPRRHVVDLVLGIAAPRHNFAVGPER